MAGGQGAAAGHPSRRADRHHPVHAAGAGGPGGPLAGVIKIADRMNPPFNLIISNVPGPAEPLYLSGREMKHFYPVSGVADGMAST